MRPAVGSTPVPYAEPHSGPTSYPRLQRGPSYAVWQPIVGLVAMLLWFLVVASLVFLPLLAVAVAVQNVFTGDTFGHAFDEALRQTRITPAAMLYINLVLASGTLVAVGLTAWVHRISPRWLFSVRPGMRWRLFRICLLLSVVALAAQLVVGVALQGSAQVDASGGGPVSWDGQRTALALVILLTTPLQALGEEVVFRGYLMQVLGGWFGTWTAIFGTALVFAVAHGVQNPPLFIDRLAFGLLAGYLVYRTGGLEAGIALHVINNIVAFGLALAFGDVTETLKVSAAPWSNIVLTVVQNGLYLVLVLWLFKRLGLSSRSPLRSAVPEPVQGAPGPA